MLFLLLSILSSTAILLIFRFTGLARVHTFSMIIVNYFIAAGLGFLFSDPDNLWTAHPSPFYFLAVLTGILFIVMFLVTARATETAGMAVTSVAGRISVVFPITFSLLFDPQDTFSMIKMTGIAIALPGVYLTIKKEKMSLNAAHVYYPVLLFFGMGLVDTTVKFAQYRYLNARNLPAFAAMLFSIAALSGVFATLVSNRLKIWPHLKKAVLIWGSILGIANFCSIYFFVSALNYRSPHDAVIDSSVVFGTNHIGIVLLSVVAGVVIFKEQLSRSNVAGIFISLLALIILVHSIR